MKILNLYSGIGGNRRFWKDVDVTAIEFDSDIANIYKHYFPNDKVIVTDAHQFLLDKYKEFDFIWSSPPCQSHSKIRQFVGVNAKGYKAIYPDMKLYEEIIFLQYNRKSKYLVENVIPYYEPLIKPSAKIGRHLFWSNFEIGKIEVGTDGLRTKNKISQVQDLHDFDLSVFKVANKRQILRNCVNSDIGNHVFSELNRCNI